MSVNNYASPHVSDSLSESGDTGNSAETPSTVLDPEYSAGLDDNGLNPTILHLYSKEAYDTICKVLGKTFQTHSELCNFLVDKVEFKDVPRGDAETRPGSRASDAMSVESHHHMDKTAVLTETIIRMEAKVTQQIGDLTARIEAISQKQQQPRTYAEVAGQQEPEARLVQKAQTTMAVKAVTDQANQHAAKNSDKLKVFGVKIDEVLAEADKIQDAKERNAAQRSALLGLVAKRLKVSDLPPVVKIAVSTSSRYGKHYYATLHFDCARARDWLWERRKQLSRPLPGNDGFDVQVGDALSWLQVQYRAHCKAYAGKVINPATNQPFGEINRDTHYFFYVAHRVFIGTRDPRRRNHRAPEIKLPAEELLTLVPHLEA